MRRRIAIVVGIGVAASCVPWLRRQPFFSVLVGVTTLALFGLIVFGGARALSASSKQKHQQADSAQSGWWSPRFRNLVLVAALLLVLILTVPHFVATTSGAYKLAVATAHQSPQFREALGVPVTEAWFSEGSFELGDQAKAEMVIPVRGRTRQGNLRALAIKDGGSWRLQQLTLELTQSGDRIDLLPAGRTPLTH
jgi:hypothetical protein